MLATDRKARGKTWRRLFAGRLVTEQKHHLATPGHFLHWLGIDPVAFKQLIEPLGVSCYDHNLVPLKLPSHQIGLADATGSQTLTTDQCHPLLRDAATYATCVQADALPHEWTAEIELLHCQWCRLLESRYRTIRQNFQHARPDLVLLVQGFEPHNAVARAAALELGVEVLALENTSRSDRLLWDRVTGLSGRNASRQTYWKYKGSVCQTTYQNYCFELIDATKRLKSTEHQSPDGVAAKRNTDSLAARKMKQTGERPYVLFLGQVYTDSSQVFGLRQWESPLEVLSELTDWCQANDYGLVLKLHPKEATGTNPVDNRKYDLLTYQKIKADTNLVARLDAVDAVIDYDNQLDTYQLIDQAAAAVTVNSQSGLEAAIRGIPVVVCGDANFGGLGFTFDAPQPDYLPVAMKLALKADSTHEANAAATASSRTDLAQEFTYLFFEKYCRPKTTDGLTSLVGEGLR